MSHSIHAVGLALGLGWLTLARASHGTVPLVLFILVMALAWGWWVWSVRKARISDFSVAAVMGWAVVFRLIALWALPVYEDDWYRYLWDGWRLAEGMPVYGVTPADVFPGEQFPEEIQLALNGINYPDRPTVYGPVVQLVLGFSAWLKPGSLLVLKGVWLGIDLLLLWALSRWARPEGFLLYAWCPLLVFEVFVNAHLELVGIGLLLAGWMLRDRGHWWFAGMVLALAAGARWFAFPLALLLISSGGWRAWAGFVKGCLCVMGLGQLMGGTDVLEVWRFLQDWEFNSTGFALIQWMFGRGEALGVFILGTVTLGIWAWVRRDIQLGAWVIMGLLVLGPVANPWYFLWLLPFAVQRVEGWHLAVMGAVSLSYICGYNYGGVGYEHPFWVRPLEVLCALAGAWWLGGRLVEERNRGGEGVIETGVATVDHATVDE